MAGEDEKYRELEQRIAALTARVYDLEIRLRLRKEESAAGVVTDRPQSLVRDAVGGHTPRLQTASFETEIGGRLLNRLGIVAVLIGVSYFLKYAFDNNWVGPAGRVIIGLLAGCGIVVWSDHLRRRGHAMFSFSLTAVGIGILYLSLWASSQLYQLIPITLAFFAMMSVTAATVALALWQDAQIVAAYAMLGGFITPVVLSTGENHPVSLFTYIAILNAGSLLLLRYRAWNRILLGAFAGSAILYAGWHGSFYSQDQFWIALTYVTLFFIGFAALPWIERAAANSMPVIVVVLANAAIYFLEVYELFDHSSNTTMAAWSAVGLGTVYLILGQLLSERAAFVSNVHWSIGIVLLIVAVPVGLKSHWITIGWFAEAGALLWISTRRANFMKYPGGAALGLGVMRLLIVDNFEVSRLLFNHRMATFAFAIAVLVLVTKSIQISEDETDRQALPILSIAINVLALWVLNQEISDAYRRQLSGGFTDQRSLAMIRDFSYSALWIAYGASLMAAGFWKKSSFLRWQALVLIAITVAKVFLYDTASLDRGYRIISFIALGALLLVTSFLYQRSRVLSRN